MEKEDRPVEIKDLNKTQLILLAILLSFVVSIATGIVTVTLLQQAPPAVTQTINRVVQQTIEKVAPDYSAGKTQTVIVKEDDLVVDAVSKTRANLLPILATADAEDSIGDAYSVGNGIFLTKSDGLDQSQKYIVRSGATAIPVKVISIYSNSIAMLAADEGNTSAKDLPASVFGKDADIKSGQTVIAISQNMIDKDTVQNVVSKEIKDKDGKVTDSLNLVLLGTVIPSSLSGAPVSDLDGTIVGFVVSTVNADGTTKTGIVGIDAIAKFIAVGPKVSQVLQNPLPVNAGDAQVQ